MRPAFAKPNCHRVVEGAPLTTCFCGPTTGLQHEGRRLQSQMVSSFAIVGPMTHTRVVDGL